MKKWLVALVAAIVLGACPAWAAFPTVRSESTGNTASGTSHAMTMPTGLASGDLLLCWIMGNQNITGFSVASSGLTELSDTDQGSGVLATFYKIATGSEGASLTVTSSGTADTASFRCKAITTGTWHGTTPPEVGTAVTGGDANPDPPALNPAGWDVEDTLWFAISGLVNNRTHDAYPANYTNTATQVGASVGLGDGRRENAVASEDPGTFTQQASATGGWVAQTIAVRPAAAAATGQTFIGGGFSGPFIQP